MVIDSAINFSNQMERMYRTPSAEDRVGDARSDDGFDICSAETAKKFLSNCTPPMDTRFYSRPYLSPRLTNTVPRRNRNLRRYRANRSLNFEMGHYPNDHSLSPSFKPKTTQDNIHLSRAMKILNKVNIDYNPVSREFKKVNRTLELHSDLSNSPSGLTEKDQSPLAMDIKSPRITRSLNFNDCQDSPGNSITHETSTESMDENQNQTPSQRNKKVKKSLSYMSLSSNESGASMDFNVLSPAGSELRYNLRAKIDDIVQQNVSSPDIPHMRDSENNLKREDKIISSTPRNLYKDFNDEDDNDDSDRPETPENIIRLIPESMSAIKKSHKKVRTSGRVVRRVQVDVNAEKMDTNDEEERPSTPPAINTCLTPNDSICSIKKSHKKDKSRKKSCGNRSEDELSDSGSLFDYTIDENAENNPEVEPRVEVNSAEPPRTPEKTAGDQISCQTPPRTGQPANDPTEAITPENQIDYIRSIMTDSIKKSHKKLKDRNKKMLSMSRKQQVDNTEVGESNQATEITCDTSDDENRSQTPDEKNSSRLLLAHFASVKKSHKKDKKRKPELAPRIIMMDQEDESTDPKRLEDDTEPLMYCSDRKSCPMGFSPKDTDNSDNTVQISSKHLGISPLDDDNITPTIAQANKRKSSSSEGNETCGEDAEEVTNDPEWGFKIYTPIKKRRGLNVDSSERYSHPVASTPEQSLASRCETPKLSSRISIPEKNRVEAAQDAEDDDGRATPENRGQLERIAALSSIKKSHKKDKSRRRHVRIEGETVQRDDNTSTLISRPSNSRESNINIAAEASQEEPEEPQPSTSYSADLTSPNSSMTTPPNGLKAKAYLKSVHTTSIKRSHKKMRKQKSRIYVSAFEISDDGTQLNEAERSLDERAMKQKNFMASDDSHDDVRCLNNSDIECPKVLESVNDKSPSDKQHVDNGLDLESGDEMSPLDS